MKTEISTKTLETVPLPRPWRLISAGIVAILVAQFIHLLITNDRFQWGVVGQYLFDEQILEGLMRTILLTGGAMILGVAGGLILAVMRLSSIGLLKSTSWMYIWFFRGTPLLVQLIFWYNLSALFPSLGLGIPFGPQFVEFNTNQLITIYVAALCGLGFNEAAYVSEITRSGIQSVDPGQTKAAKALGMSGFLTFRRIVMPQAMRVIIPPLGNRFIGMLKMSALVSVIAMPDLLYSAQLIYNRTFNPIPLLIVACLWYLALTTILSVLLYYVEGYYNKGHREESSRRPAKSLLSVLGRGTQTNEQTNEAELS